MRRITQHKNKFFVSGTIIVVFFLAINTISLTNFTGTTTLKIIPANERPLIGETTTADIVVEAKEPINALEVQMVFSPELMEVVDVTFEDSFIDLWVFEPSFSNASGTVSFTGGTTRRGGFIGSGIIATITYRGAQPGKATVQFENARILAHDGFGTEIINETINTELIIEALKQTGGEKAESIPVSVVIQGEMPPSPDLNDDGDVGIIDMSIFALHLTGDYVYRSDFNQDGNIDLKDASILLSRIFEAN